MVSIIIEKMKDWWFTIMPHSLLKAKSTYFQVSFMLIDFNENRRVSQCLSTKEETFCVAELKQEEYFKNDVRKLYSRAVRVDQKC